MANITLVGDVHGKIKEYKELLAKHPEPVIQLGDMGCGFVNVPQVETNHRFIRGNHDDPQVARLHPNYLGDWGCIKEYGIFYMGGAFSIDKDDRIEFMRQGSRPCWWEDEELSPLQLNAAADLYFRTKPRIVVSHEAPSIAGLKLLQIEMKRLYKYNCTQSRTAQVMQQMFDDHQPDLWVFGHYHFSRNFKIGDTRFLCLNELEPFELDTNNPTAGFYE